MSVSKDDGNSSTVQLHLSRLWAAGAGQGSAPAGARTNAGGIASPAGGAAAAAAAPMAVPAGTLYMRSAEPRHLVLLGVSREHSPALTARAAALGRVQKHFYNVGKHILTVHFEQQAAAEALAAEAAAGTVPGLAGKPRGPLHFALLLFFSSLAWSLHQPAVVLVLPRRMAAALAWEPCVWSAKARGRVRQSRHGCRPPHGWHRSATCLQLQVVRFVRAEQRPTHLRCAAQPGLAPIASSCNTPPPPPPPLHPTPGAGTRFSEFKHPVAQPAQHAKATQPPRAPAPAAGPKATVVTAHKAQKGKPPVEFDYSDTQPSSTVRVKRLAPQATRWAVPLASRHAAGAAGASLACVLRFSNATAQQQQRLAGSWVPALR